MTKSTTVSDIMVKDVVSVTEDTPLMQAAKILEQHNFSGVPVLDRSSKLVGILTEYDLISRGSYVHLPTMQKILQELQFAEKSDDLKKDFSAIESLRVRDVMNSEPFTLKSSASFKETVKAFRDHHRINPIIIIDDNKHVVGVVSRYDIIKLFSTG